MCFSGKNVSCWANRRTKTHACSVGLCTVPQLPPEGKTGVCVSTLLGPLAGGRETALKGVQRALSGHPENEHSSITLK